MQCGEMGCLPVCTACVLVPSAMPSPLPTVEQIRADATTDWSRLLLGLASCIFVLCALLVATRLSCRRHCASGLNDDNGSIGSALARLSNQQPLLQLDEGILTKSGSVELVERSVMIRSYETSPAPVFVIGGDSMRISIWSPGMAIAAPMVRKPVGGLLSDLPFMDASDVCRLDRFLRRIFEAPAEHDHSRTYMLHLDTKNRHVLLEMVATHFFVRDSEPVVVMTGRQVDSDLAVLLARGSAAASEANYDVTPGEVWGSEPSHLRPVSQAGSIKGGDAVDDILQRIVRNRVPDDSTESSVGSSLTMSTFTPASKICGGSTVSSLTLPTVYRQPSAFSGACASSESSLESLMIHNVPERSLPARSCVASWP